MTSDLTQRVTWRRDIQGLRAIAVLMVVLFHARLPVPGGFTGVDVFFVISGFVITGMLVREHSSKGRVSLSKFYVRRFKRLTPALILMVVIVMLLAIILVSPLWMQLTTALTGLGATYLVANLVVQATTGGYFEPAAEVNPLLHTWSLSVEEQFYLIYPVTLVFGWALARRLRLPKTVPVVLLSLIAAISLAFALLPKQIPGAPQWTIPLLGYYSPVVRTWEFAAGALLLFATLSVKRISRRVSLFLGLAGLVGLGFSLVFINSSFAYPSAWTLLPVGATMCLILAGFNPDNSITRMLGSRPLVYTGDRSYSWYLWHWPVIVFAVMFFPSNPVVALTAGCLSFLPALVSFRLVEQPLRSRSMTRRGLLFLSIGLISASTATAILVLVGTQHGWGSRQVQAAQEQLLPDHLAQAAGCHVFTPMSPSGYDACWFNTGGSGRPIYLVGDSNGDHFSDALVGAGEVVSRPVNLATVSSCPFTRPVTSQDPSLTPVQRTRCGDYAGNTFAWLRTQRPGTVVIATAGGQYFTEGIDSEKSLNELSETILALKAMGHEVLVVEPIPFIYRSGSDAFWTPAQCPMISILKNSCVEEMTLIEAEIRQGSGWQSIRRTTEQAGGRVIDVTDSICPKETCLTYRDEEWIYRDSLHLTVNASERLVPNFAKALG